MATASALTNHGTIVSIPHRNQPVPNIPQEWSLEAAAEAIRSESTVTHPTLPAAIGHCLYLRRSALELVGGFDEAFAPGYEEEVDFSQRCIRHGLSPRAGRRRVRVAPRARLVHERRRAEAPGQTHHELIADALPVLRRLGQRGGGGVRHAAALGRWPPARRALRGMPSITIDGRILTAFMTGTQLHVLEIIVALHELEPMPIRVIVPPDLGDYAADVLAGLERVRLVTEEQALAEPPTDVVHRPYQVSSYDDLRLLLRRRRAAGDHPAGPDRLPQPRLPRQLRRAGRSTAR